MGRSCLAKRRHVISLVDSSPHVEFLESFYSEVTTFHSGVRKWYLKLKTSPHKVDQDEDVDEEDVEIIADVQDLLSDIPQLPDAFSAPSLPMLCVDESTKIDGEHVGKV